jgi:hypothetical protein
MKTLVFFSCCLRDKIRKKIQQLRKNKSEKSIYFFGKLRKTETTTNRDHNHGTNLFSKASFQYFGFFDVDHSL